jgi:3-methyladenine DNA glycosylase AlkD
MTAEEVLEELRALGKESYRRVMMKHGVPEPIFGASIEDMKKIVKRVGPSHELAMALFRTGVYDAMYLAGLLAEDEKMSKKDLKAWANGSTCSAISEYTVAWCAAGSSHGWELALEWIESKKDRIASTGWATLTSLVSISNDADLDIPKLRSLVDRIARDIHSQQNRTRYTMNGFLIAAGCFVAPLTEACLKAAAKVGKVTVDMGETACKVPSAMEYIEKVRARGSIGKKRKSAKC